MVMDSLHEHQWAYYAGLFDGEGTIKRYPNSRGGRRLSVTNTYYPLLEKIKQDLPAGYVHHRETQKGTPIWSVQWNGIPQIVWILEGMLPHMVIKRQAAEDLLFDCRTAPGMGAPGVPRTKTTQCDKGHPRVPGQKRCKTCWNEYMREYQRKQRAARKG